MQDTDAKIIAYKDIPSFAKKLSDRNDTLVLAGGCFDLLHVGHTTFLEKSKKKGDILIVLLESDEMIQKLKGQKRPINTQKDRASVLASLSSVDYVLLLQPQMTTKDYETLVIMLKPAIISTTKGDPFRFHKEKHAQKVKAKVVDVTDSIPEKSTTKLFELLNEYI